jgi:translation initiation factor IF-2
MPHKQTEQLKHRKAVPAAKGSVEGERLRLEVVLKGDTAGSMEAAAQGILGISLPGVEIALISSGVGGVSKSDVLMAETGSRVITGFQVDVLPGVEKVAREHVVEIRLYSVIYDLVEDLSELARGMVPSEVEEEILGTANVIALFKSSRRGVIVGCEIISGSFSVGQHFRIISAMGPVYSGVIESLHIEEKAVSKVAQGQQAGIKIKGFTKARVGDLVEVYRPPKKPVPRWQPTGRVIRK